MRDLPIQGLERAIDSTRDHELALRHAPIIRFDANEPFFPSVVGYTVFRKSAPSPSFPRQIQLGEAIDCAIEYAIWWDWDIQHLYELEHIWVYIGKGGQLVAAEASWHGGYHVMLDADNPLPLEGRRLALYSEPGKHAFAREPGDLLQRRAKTIAGCGAHAGRMGVHVTPLFTGIIKGRKPLANRLVHGYLESRRFLPSFDFSIRFDLRHSIILPWRHLYAWIPGRVEQCIDRLRATVAPHQRRVLRIAHRGASAYAQENSLDSFRKAAQLGADLVEIDIRVSADHVPVVTHDSSLKRLYGIEGIVSDYRLDELRVMTAAAGGILSFDEALESCRGLGLGLYLDLKQLTMRAAADMLAAIDTRQYLRNVIFGSFRPDTLADIKAARPDARTSILFSATRLDAVKLAQSIGADYVHPCWENRATQPHRLLTREWIEAARRAELGIVCWHEERPAEIAALMKLGVDAICSDKPELLLAAARSIGGRLHHRGNEATQK